MKKKVKFYIALFCVSMFVGYKFFNSNNDKTQLNAQKTTKTINNEQRISSIAENVNKIIENSAATTQSENSLAPATLENLERDSLAAINAEPVISDDIKNEILSIKGDDILLGDPTAPVKIIQYSSLTCPACKYYQTKIFEQLRTDYIDTGKVVYVAREFPFDKQAYEAAILARCGGKEKYYTFLSVLFKNQESWAYRKNYQELLTNIGQLGGVEAEAFAKCINDPAVNQVVSQNNRDATQGLKLTWAPVVFINGTKIDNEVSHDYELLSNKIKEHLDK
jgi:protein-disulfide isomerase